MNIRQVLIGFVFSLLCLTNAQAQSSQLAGTGSHACAIVGGAAKCWGRNVDGRLGNGTIIDSSIAADVQGLSSGVTAISTGCTHTCAIVNGAVKCWGNNDSGQLGTGNKVASLVPVSVTGLTSGATAISAGCYSSCAVVSGAVKCWGANADGEIGDGTTTERLSPTAVSNITSGASAVAVGTLHACAVVSGVVKCWGQNVEGQLGDGTTAPRLTAVNVKDLGSGATAVSASSAYSCAIVGGAAKCWGFNGYGQFGNNATALSPATSVTTVNGLSSGVSAIATGEINACAVVSGGAVKCWGDNRFGQLGDNTKTNRLVPTTVSGIASAATAVSSGVSSCAVVSGAVKCWGSNYTGALGVGNTIDSQVPVSVVMPVATATPTPTAVPTVPAGATKTPTPIPTTPPGQATATPTPTGGTTNRTPTPIPTTSVVRVKLSGKVVNSKGEGMARVIVWASGVGSMATNSAGAYSFSGAVLGAKVKLTFKRTGYSFNPSEMTITAGEQIADVVGSVNQGGSSYGCSENDVSSLALNMDAGASSLKKVGEQAVAALKKYASAKKTAANRKYLSKANSYASTIKNSYNVLLEASAQLPQATLSCPSGLMCQKVSLSSILSTYKKALIKIKQSTDAAARDVGTVSKKSSLTSGYKGKAAAAYNKSVSNLSRFPTSSAQCS